MSRARAADGVAGAAGGRLGLLSRLLDHALGAGNYHAIEYGLFYADVHADARARAAAFLTARR